MTLQHDVWRAGDALAALASMRGEASEGVPPRRPASGDGRIDVILTAAFGSMGDQALSAGALALADELSREARILVPGPAEPWHGVGLTRVVSLEPWNHGRLRAISETAIRELNDSDMVVIGADTIDGRYDHRPLALRVRLLNLAVAKGRSASLVNFSFSEEPTRTSLKLLRALHKHVSLWARDEDSQRRAQRLLARPVGLAPDVGALMPAHISEAVATAASGRVDKFTVLVPNAHLASDFGMQREEIVRAWARLARNLSSEEPVVVMPHDTREKPGDVQLAREVVDAASDLNAKVELFVPASAAEAKGLVSKAGVCIAARMHACVGALSAGTPTVGLDYLDKFAGQGAWYGDLAEIVPFEEALDVARIEQALVDLRTRHKQPMRGLRWVSPKEFLWLQ